MAKARRTPNISKLLSPRLPELMDRLLAAGADALLDALPVESGHGHEAFITGLDRASPGPLTERVLSRYDQDRSHDPKAAKAATGRLTKGPKKIRCYVKVNLPFLVTLDKGGQITVTGYRTGGTGTKTKGIETIGELYARRRTFKRGKQGVLMWVVGGTRYYAKVRNVAPAGFMDAAYNAIRNEAKR